MECHRIPSENQSGSLETNPKENNGRVRSLGWGQVGIRPVPKFTNKNGESDALGNCQGLRRYRTGDEARLLGTAPWVYVFWETTPAMGLSRNGPGSLQMYTFRCCGAAVRTRAANTEKSIIRGARASFAHAKSDKQWNAIEIPSENQSGSLETNPKETPRSEEQRDEVRVPE